MPIRSTLPFVATLALTLTACSNDAEAPQAQASVDPCESIVQDTSEEPIDAEAATATVKALWEDMAHPETETLTCHFETPFQEEYYPQSKLTQLAGAIQRTESCELKVGDVQETDDAFRTVTNLEECTFLEGKDFFGWTISKETGLVSGSYTADDAEDLSRNYLDAK